jgi:hypothetical protein
MDKKLYAIWQDNVVKGYIALEKEQADAINSLPNIGLYLGFDCFTEPEHYAEARTLCRIKALFGDGSR